MSPQRIQRRRIKGWRMPAGAVYVGRPTVYGNDWELRDAITWGIPAERRQQWLVDQYRAELDRMGGVSYPSGLDLDRSLSLDEIREKLAGRDLVCWCPLDQPCHADVLLEIANKESR